MWQNHVKYLLIQGRLLNVVCVKGKSISWKSICFILLKNVIKFAVNSCIETLATNAYLNLCKGTNTLHHVLNYCEHKLERYAQRYNSVLKNNFDMLEILKSDLELHVDLLGYLKGVSTIPLISLIRCKDLVIYTHIYIICTF